MTHPTPTITVNLDMSPHGAQRASHPHLYDLVLEWILANPDRPCYRVLATEATLPAIEPAARSRAIRRGKSSSSLAPSSGVYGHLM